MKSWHVIVLDGAKTIEDHEIHKVKDARDKYDELKAKYAVSHPHYSVKREWY